MTQYIDAILYIPSISGLLALFPQTEVVDGVLQGFDRTPVTMNGDEGLVYVRMMESTADEFLHYPVQILASAVYNGPGTADRVYGYLLESPEELDIYNDVYDQSVRIWYDELAETHMHYTPPFRFGQLA